MGTTEAQDVDEVSWGETCEYYQGRAKAEPSEKKHTGGEMGKPDPEKEYLES